MNAFKRRGQHPLASIDELTAAVRRESAAALSTAEAFVADQRSPRLTVPRRFPGPDALSGQPECNPRDQDTGPRQSGDPG